jgi:hypothetical protein
MESFQMTRAVTSVGGSPLLFTLRHEGQQGEAGLQSSGRAFEYLLTFCAGFVAQLWSGEGGSSIQAQASSFQNLLATMEK